jgi:hypothetical protein
VHLVRFEPFLRQRKNLFAHDRRYSDRNPILARSLMVGAVTRCNAAAQPYRSCNSLARRNRRLAKTSLPLVGRIAQHAPNHRAFPTPASLGRGDVLFIQVAGELARLYAAARLFVNFFQPSFKLLEKSREGAVVRKRYDAPATPCQRLLADLRTSEAARSSLIGLQERLDPVSLLHEIRERQRRLVEIADKAGTDETQPASVEEFLAALKTAWREGTPRPTEQQPPPKLRW